MATDRSAAAARPAARRRLRWADARRIAVVAIIALSAGCTSLDGPDGARRPAQDAVLDDLAVLIECRGDAGAFTRLWTALDATLDTGDEPHVPGAGPAWTVRESDAGPYAFELDLPASITVAGRRTRHVALGATGATVGAVAFLDGTSPARIARRLGLAREPGEPEDVWTKELETVEGDAGLQNISLSAGAVMERDDEGEMRAVRGRVMVACLMEPGPDIDYD